MPIEKLQVRIGGSILGTHKTSVTQLTSSERDRLRSIVPLKLRKAITDSDRPEERAEGER